MTETLKSQSAPDNIKKRNVLSLRAKILLGNLLIVFFTVAAMGYFVFSRSQAANEFLAEQFDISTTREIENRLTIITAEEASNISIFFSSMTNVINTFATTTGAFISNDDVIVPEESEWNAYVELTQLPNGSWDNSNNEIASIFLPANMSIRDNLARELAALKGLDYFTQGLLMNNPDVIAIYFGGKSGETVYYPNIDLAAIVPYDFDITNRPWYINAIETDKVNVWSVPYQDAALNGLVITSSAPVYDNTGVFRGVAGIDVQLATITDRVSSLAIGKSGYGFLIDADGRVIAIPSKGYQDFNITEEEIQSGDIENLSLINRVTLEVFEVLAKMTSGQSGVRLVNINGVNRYIAYKPIPIIGYSLGIVVDEDELLEEFVNTNTIIENETRQTIFNAVGVIVFLLSVAGLASYGIGNSITAPLGKLTKVAEKIAAGNLDLRADDKTNDEIGILGSTLNSMTSAARELITNLEGRVAERTKAVEKRATQIQAVAEVGQSVAAQRDLEELLSRATHLISNRFGFYHVGIFLVDSRSEYATLRASNSSGGAQMLERGHRLRVGTEGIVGTAAGTGEARIALDVGKDAVFFDNPELPQTRSEMALPLIAGGETLGILDIQSLEANAFSEDDIPTLQVLADQLATAVQNANLLRDTQEALRLARKTTNDISRDGWKSLLQMDDSLGYVSSMDGEVTPVSKNVNTGAKHTLSKSESTLSADQRTLNVPVTVRGQIIAMMRLVKPDASEPWSPGEITDVEQLANQISNTLDSARLYQEAQQRAKQEQAIGEITSVIGSSTHIDNILRSTVQALGRQLDDTEIVLELEANHEWSGDEREF